MIAIIDYGAGNMQSVEKALRHLGCQCQITADPGELAAAQAAVLPGVGAFGDAMGPAAGQGAGGAHPAVRVVGKAFSRHLPGTADLV